MIDILQDPLVMTLLGGMTTAGTTAITYVWRLGQRQAAHETQTEKQFAILALSQGAVEKKIDRLERKLDDLTDYLLRQHGAPTGPHDPTR